MTGNTARLAGGLIAVGVLLTSCGSDNFRIGEKTPSGVDGVTSVSVYVDAALENDEYEDITKDIWKDMSSGVSVSFKCESDHSKTVFRASMRDGFDYSGRRFTVTC